MHQSLPEGPAASARRSAKSPLPQQTSRARPPTPNPVHFTAARFHTRCRPSGRGLNTCSFQLNVSTFQLLN